MNNEKEQTAVDCVIEYFSKYIDMKIHIEEIEKIKENEKEKIIDSWRDGFINGRKSVINQDFSNATHYYNETYGGNKWKHHI